MSICFLRVSSVFTALTHLTQSQRASGVMSFHSLWISLFETIAFFISGGTSGFIQSLVGSKETFTMSPAAQSSRNHGHTTRGELGARIFRKSQNSPILNFKQFSFKFYSHHRFIISEVKIQS